MASQIFALGRGAARKAALAALLTLLAPVSEPQAQTQSVDGAPILLYHRFDPSRTGSTTVTDAAFEAQLDWMEHHGYRVAPLQTIVADIAAGRQPPDHTVAITVDDGRRSQYTDMFPIILRHHTPVTLFVYTRAISYEPDALTWDMIEEMRRSGLVDVQSHTCTHPNFAVERRRRSAADFASLVDVELSQSKAILERRLGRPVSYLAWPYGEYDRELERAAQQARYEAAFGVADRLAAPGGDLFAIPRIVVTDRDRDERLQSLLAGARSGVALDETELAASCPVP